MWYACIGWQRVLYTCTCILISFHLLWTLENIDDMRMHLVGIILALVLFLSQKEMLEVLYNVFQLKIPVWTEDYRAAVASVGETLAITKLQHFYKA